MKNMQWINVAVYFPPQWIKLQHKLKNEKQDTLTNKTVDAKVETQYIYMSICIMELIDSTEKAYELVCQENFPCVRRLIVPGTHICFILFFSYEVFSTELFHSILFKSFSLCLCTIRHLSCF